MSLIPKLTIVTVVFNDGESIEETVQSVLNQNYDNFEYIIIDGASSDSTLSILEKYREKFAHLVSEPDRGIYYAMNKAITLAKGEWINFLNAGDTFVDEKILTQISSELDDSYSFIYGDRNRVKESGELEYEKAGNLDDTLHREVVFHQSLFTKTELLKKVKYNTCYSLAADYEFVIKSWANKEKFKYVQKVISNFREGGRSRQQYLKAQIEAIKTIFEYQKDQKKWKHNIYFEHFVRSNIGFILNKNLQFYKRKYPGFSLVPQITDNRLIISSNIQDENLVNFLKVINDPFKNINSTSVKENDAILDDLLKSISKLPSISVATHPISKYKAYKTVLRKYKKFKKNNRIRQNFNERPSNPGKKMVNFSVVTVTYNAGDFLERTIKSVRSQQNASFEYLIIDGKSTDSTLNIINNNDPIIDFWLSEPDSGVYEAMNKGIKNSKGDYIIFMNAGDTFADPEVLEKVSRSISRNDEIIYGDRVYIHENGKEELQKAKPIESVFERMPFGHQACFIKTEILKEEPFNTTYKYAADYEKIISLYKGGKKFTQLKYPICNFLYGGKSESGIRPYLEALKIILDNCDDKNIIKNNSYFKAFKNNTESLLEL